MPNSTVRTVVSLIFLLLPAVCISADEMAGMPGMDHQSMGLTNMDMGMGMHMEGDIARGEHLAVSACSACHGRYGISSSDAIPNLAGQQAMYLYGALTAYRDKVRHVQVMNDVASKLSDRDIADVTAYYSHLPDQKW